MLRSGPVGHLMGLNLSFLPFVDSQLVSPSLQKQQRSLVQQVFSWQKRSLRGESAGITSRSRCRVSSEAVSRCVAADGMDG